MRDSLEEKLDFETKSRTVGCKKQLESFSFFFELNLGQKFLRIPITYQEQCNKKRCPL